MRLPLFVLCLAWSQIPVPGVGGGLTEGQRVRTDVIPSTVGNVVPSLLANAVDHLSSMMGGQVGRPIDVSPSTGGVRRTSLPGTAWFTIEDLNRMRGMLTDGISLNYQGNASRPEDALLTRAMINRMILQLDPEAVLTAGLPGTAQFTLNALNRIRTEMNRNNAIFNVQGERAGPLDTVLTMEMIDRMFDQIPQGIRRAWLPGTAGFTMEGLNRMLRIMITTGAELNYQGSTPQSGDEKLTRAMINNMILQLDPEAVLTAGLPGTAEFTLDALNRMRTEMNRNNVNFNYRGERAGPLDTILTKEMIDRMFGQLPQAIVSQNATVITTAAPGAAAAADATGPGTGESGSSSNSSTTSGGTFKKKEFFTLDDLTRMLDLMATRNEEFNFHGQRAQLGESVLTADMINQMIAHIRQATIAQNATVITTAAPGAPAAANATGLGTGGSGSSSNTNGAQDGNNTSPCTSFSPVTVFIMAGFGAIANSVRS